jgi:hypothetical protein
VADAVPLAGVLTVAVAVGEADADPVAWGAEEDSGPDGVAETTELLGAALLGTMLLAAALLGAAEDALGASGISMGAPASAQVFSTAAMVVSLSAALQAPSTQG